MMLLLKENSNLAQEQDIVHYRLGPNADLEKHCGPLLIGNGHQQWRYSLVQQFPLRWASSCAKHEHQKVLCFTVSSYRCNRELREPALWALWRRGLTKSVTRICSGVRYLLSWVSDHHQRKPPQYFQCILPRSGIRHAEDGMIILSGRQIVVIHATFASKGNVLQVIVSSMRWMHSWRCAKGMIWFPLQMQLK